MKGYIIMHSIHGLRSMIPRGVRQLQKDRRAGNMRMSVFEHKRAKANRTAKCTKVDEESTSPMPMARQNRAERETNSSSLGLIDHILPGVRSIEGATSNLLMHSGPIRSVPAPKCPCVLHPCALNVPLSLRLQPWLAENGERRRK